MSNLVQVDEGDIQRGHYYLDPQDQCLYLGRYHPDSNPSSGLNQLIWNFKKQPSLANTNPSEYAYKAPAISTLAGKLKAAFGDDAINERITFVPIPPSKARHDPDYDDRLVQLLNTMTFGLASPDVRDILSTRQTRGASHNSSPPQSATAVAQLQSTIDLTIPPNFEPRKYTVLVDDVLRRGTHFKACKNIIEAQYPDTQIVGVFLARTNY